MALCPPYGSLFPLWPSVLLYPLRPSVPSTALWPLYGPLYPLRPFFPQLSGSLYSPRPLPRLLPSVSSTTLCSLYGAHYPSVPSNPSVNSTMSVPSTLSTYCASSMTGFLTKCVWTVVLGVNAGNWRSCVLFHSESEKITHFFLLFAKWCCFPVLRNTFRPACSARQLNKWNHVYCFAK